MKNLLTQNSKMKKSIDGMHIVYNFGIEAGSTCPMKDTCASGCYAQSGTYRFSNVKKAYQYRTMVTRSNEFVERMNNEINTLLKKHTGLKLVIRIHDSGDFYNMEYLLKWIDIIKLNPNVKFYAYTKSLHLFDGNRKISAGGILPSNFGVIFSYGGKMDKYIKVDEDFHSKVFKTQEELLAAGYVNASDNDLIAALGENNKIGLVYHGIKKIENTEWLLPKVG